MKTVGMVSVFTALVLTLCTGIFLVAIWKVDDSLYNQGALLVDSFSPTLVSAEAFVVFDVETGKILASKNEHSVLPVASITKLLAAVVVYESVDLSATTTLTWSDVNTYGDAGKLYAYEVYSVRELTYPLLLESSNDAAAALLRLEPSLVSQMNTYVQAKGLTHTTFTDASGLSSGNTSTAQELSVLAKMLYALNPHIFDITRLRQFIGTKTAWINNNPLATEIGYKGGKHGFTNEAGKTAIAFFDDTLASGETRTVGYVLLQSDNLQTDITQLRSEVGKTVRIR
jgi:D-alanyl-D-alanine carboxypeptidase